MLKNLTFQRRPKALVWSKGLTMYYAGATNGVFFLALVLMLIRKFSRGLSAKFRENKALAKWRNQSVDY